MAGDCRTSVLLLLCRRSRFPGEARGATVALQARAGSKLVAGDRRTSVLLLICRRSRFPGEARGATVALQAS